MSICFLDIDGTLVLTGGAGQTAFARTLATEFGITEISREVAFAGRSDRAIAMDLFRIHGVEPTAENWRRFYAGYLRRLDETLPTHEGNVLPGVVGLLEALTERGDVALGLLTGNVRGAARRKLTHYGLWGWFAFGGFGDDHVDRNDIAAAALAEASRHLEGVRSLLRLEISATYQSNQSQNTPAPVFSEQQVVVIGDTLNDISCGRSIGARCVAVPTGHTPADVLRHGEPDVLVETLEDAAPILALFDVVSE
jgi:phosphoglycolate phosphatase